MHISSRQMEGFRQTQRLEYEKRMAVHLKSKFPDEFCDYEDPELLDHVHELVQRALNYNVNTRFDVQRFLEYTVFHGNDFDADNTAQEILKNDTLNSTQKMDALFFEFAGR